MSAGSTGRGIKKEVSEKKRKANGRAWMVESRVVKRTKLSENDENESLVQKVL